MTPSPENRAVIAAAGSRKTQHIVDTVLSEPHKRALVTTYTNENFQQLRNRLSSGTGVFPSHVTVMGWFSLLVGECARPYQSFVFDDVSVIKGFNFVTPRPRFMKRSNPRTFYLDPRSAMWRDGVSDFACQANARSGGLVMKRLAEIYDHIYIDEVQDLAGHDLDFPDLLFETPLSVTVVGDPRQATFATNTSQKNSSFKGSGIARWLAGSRGRCLIEHRRESYRCNQAICDFADALYTDLPATISKNAEITGHDGVFAITPAEVADYVRQHDPVVLRYNKTTRTSGLAAVNFGVSKGSTYDRVLIFPTSKMADYYRTRKDPSEAGDIPKLYVAVTRAKYSVAFVIP